MFFKEKGIEPLGKFGGLNKTEVTQTKAFYDGVRYSSVPLSEHQDLNPHRKKLAFAKHFLIIISRNYSVFTSL